MKYIISFLIVILSFQTYAQKWDNIYYETDNLTSFVISSKRTYDGGYLMLKRNPLNQYVIQKTDINGQILWIKRIINEDNNFFSGFYFDVSSSGLIFISGCTMCGEENTCTNVICLNQCGEVLWSKYFELDVYNYGLHIFGYNDGSAILHTRYAGQYNGYIPQERTQLIKLNNQGNIEWINHITPEYEFPNFQDAEYENVNKTNNGFLFTGYCFMFSPPNLLYLKGIIVETDNHGNETYVNTYYNEADTMNGELLYSINYEDYYISSGYEILLDSLGNKRSAMVGKINKQNGEILYHANFPMDTLIREDYGYQIIESPFGYYLIKAIFFYSNPHGMLEVVKLNDDFFQEGSVIFYNKTNARDKCAFLDSDNNIFLSGYQWSDSAILYPFDGMAMKLKPDLTWDSFSIDNSVYDSLCSYQIDSSSMYISCEPFLMVGLNEENRITKKDLFGLSIYPNPSQGEVTFSTKVLSDNRYIEIYNISGVLIEKLEFQWNINQILYNSSCLSPGVYVAKLIIEGQTSDVTKFIIQ